MAKISGFSGDYVGLQKNEAWQRIYEYGKNYMPVRENRIKQAYMKIFRPTTKVIRDGIVEKIKTEYLVPGDNVIVEAGQFIPVDGVILEQKDFEVINNLDGQKDGFVYQGAKVISGKAIIEAEKTSDATYTGNVVKQIDGYNIKKNRFARKLKKWTIGVSSVSVIFAIFAFIFSMMNLSTDLLEKTLRSLLSAVVMLILCIPVGFISAFLSSLSRQHQKLRECKMKIRRWFSLPEAEKITMICLEEDFLKGEYSRKIGRLYEVGISIAVLTDKKLEEVENKVREAGICNGEIAFITKNELEALEEEDFRKVICENFVFCELDQKMKDKIILTFEEMGVRCLTSGYGLEGVLRIENADIGISKNNQKGSLDYELADAALYDSNFDAIYEYIRQSFICSCSLKNYIYHMLVFQFPILLFILIMLINKINIGELWAQGVVLIFAIIPAAMFLIEKDYSISRLIDLKENKEKFLKRFIICMFVGISLVVVLLLVGVILMRGLALEPHVSANVCLAIMMALILIIAVVEKVKFPYKGKIALRKQGPPIVEKSKEKKNSKADWLKKETVEEKPKEKNEKKEIKEKEVKEKPVKEKPAKKKNSDIGNEML